MSRIIHKILQNIYLRKAPQNDGYPSNDIGQCDKLGSVGWAEDTSKRPYTALVIDLYNLHVPQAIHFKTRYNDEEEIYIISNAGNSARLPQDTGTSKDDI